MANLLSAPLSGDRGAAAGVPGHLTQDLTLSAKSVRHARKIVTESVCMWGRDDVAFDVGIVVAELLTNVLQHADPPQRDAVKRARLVVQVLLGLPTTGHLVVVVHDDDPTMPAERRADEGALGGRGLTLVRGLTEELAFVPADGGKDVVAVFSLNETGKAAA
ncbi:ATP-binding protein [Streptomyces racemochromogenes]|uniref:ATP-binding protein n=1 Tax=Streptomyces racemochromogenes TaxID=67353 RepID=UPI0031E9A9B8